MKPEFETKVKWFQKPIEHELSSPLISQLFYDMYTYCVIVLIRQLLYDMYNYYYDLYNYVSVSYICNIINKVSHIVEFAMSQLHISTLSDIFLLLN